MEDKERKKKVDESYKNQVEKENKEEQPSEKTEQPSKEEMVFPEANFSIFISGLGMQAMISLGEIENPITQKKEMNLEHAKYLIDTINMIKEKTENNLSKEESEVVESIIYQLQMKYVEKKND